MNRPRKEAPPPVRCALCSMPFPRIFEGMSQGSDCASSRGADGMIYSNYGSSYDGSKFQSFFLAATDPICDICLARMILQGKAVYVGTFF